MDPKILTKRLNENKIVYIKDLFDEYAVKIVDKGKLLHYLKPNGHKEVLTDEKYKTTFETVLYGTEITKEEYDKF